MRKIIFLLVLATTVFSAKSQWSSNPSVNKIVSDKLGSEYDPILLPDGANGAISIFTGDVDGNIYAQRLTTGGAIAWGSSSNPVSVCVSTGQKYSVSAIADGAGGAFVAWTDYRHDQYVGEIYLQKISATGVVQWAANGLRVTNSPASDEYQPLLCLDGGGGVIITWYGDDTLAQNIQCYAQRYNSAGAAQWGATGIQVSTAAGFRAPSTILSDGANGAIIFFIDTRNDPNGFDYTYLSNFNLSNADIYAQRLDGSGTRLWGAAGAAIITAPGNQNDDIDGKALPDGSGNVILVFNDGRNDPGSYLNYDIFAQKVNSNGVVQWAATGVPVCTAAENQFITGIASDGAGGVVVSMLYESLNRMYTQRIISTGANAWTLNGIPVSLASEQIYDGTVVADGNGNSIFSYADPFNNMVKAQKLNSSGTIQWGATGTIVCNNALSGPYISSIMLSDAGSVIVAWPDNRNGALPSAQDIYASKVLSSGVLAAAVVGFVTVANGNWNNPAIWSGGAVPPAGAPIQIRHAVIGNINATCASLVIAQPGGNLTVLPGINIAVGN